MLFYIGIYSFNTVSVAAAIPQDSTSLSAVRRRMQSELIYWSAAANASLSGLRRSSNFGYSSSCRLL